MKKKILRMTAASFLIGALYTSPVSQFLSLSPLSVAATEEKLPTAELSEWKGQWNSISSYLEDETLESAYEVIAERDDLSVEEAKKTVHKRFDTAFSSIDIDDSSITFYKEKYQDNLEKDQILDKLEYKFVKAIPFEHVGVTYYWFIFETAADTDFKQIALMDVHGEDTLAHFHLFYDKENVEKVIEAGGDWFPTFVRPDAELENIKEEIEE